MVWLFLLFAIAGLAFFSYILVLGIESLAKTLNLKDYIFMLIVFPVFSSLPDLVIIILNFIYGGKLGPGMALSAAVGQPFVVIVFGIPAVLFLNLIKYGKNGSRLFKDSKGRTNRILYIPLLVLIFAYLSIIFLTRIYLIISITLITIIAFYIYIKNLKDDDASEDLKKISTLLTVSCIIAGSIGLILFGKLLVESVIQISLMTRISPFTQSFIVFPLSASMPEIFTSFSLILMGKKEAAIASLLGEIVITATLYPALIFVFSSPTISIMVMFGMAVEIVSAIATIITSFKGHLIYVMPLDLTIIVLYLFIAF